VVPDLLESPFSHSIMKRANDKGLLTVNVHNLRKWAINKHMQVDDYQFGGGAGMVIMPEPLANAIDELQQEGKYDEIIFMTPDGKNFNQKTANSLSMKENILIICGHYKGIDERIRQRYVTMEISIGDYVLSGGELAAAVVVDAVGRLIPGVLNDETSALFDSFQDNLLAPPVYTRPADFRGDKVPDILTQGDPKKVEEWRHEQSLIRTKERRPDLLED
jgi:tRNA (guanine37-N1)-methyltransferase